MIKKIKKYFVIFLYIKSMRINYLSDKYIILLNEIIINYDKNKSEKKILNVLLYNHVWESIDTCVLCHYTTFKKSL